MTALVENQGYILHSKEYKDAHSRLTYECPKGHIYSASWAAFNVHGQRCSICANNQKFTYDHIKSQVESFGHKLKSKDYKNSKQKLDIECANGHSFSKNWHQLRKYPQLPYLL